LIPCSKPACQRGLPSGLRRGREPLFNVPALPPAFLP
jgi:hypothetical protein